MQLDFIGTFVNGHPTVGTLTWPSGDASACQMKNGKCSGKKVSAAGREIKGKFDWTFDHDDHSFTFGNLKEVFW